ncbi:MULTISPECIES: hypothetical protein [unclassified Methanoculleus]|uniref:hypothetical protein n=1 Tax=unclassified Methanoculleus TaxID=2619537 RepID=UPI0025CCC7BC|nr:MULTISPECIES: hypothetical protein [unclassified Methanoculleus]MCK9318555.1 hypothetical protein [Methanoculleus sp.]MDD2253112.1 hypothetical protein [Methanoculleus sp.]MDD2787543.1 hypothetical protein [Methanoculleus sp.]MDD3216949.1 hypothetical protein [Methanoculleus sp.]MDD4313316.1 hypothetical protein [Methanoculleus sp.]
MQRRGEPTTDRGGIETLQVLVLGFAVRAGTVERRSRCVCAGGEAVTGRIG